MSNMIRHINIKETDGNSICQRHGQKYQTGEVYITHSDLHGESIFKNISIRPGIKIIIANQECHRNLQMDYDIYNAPVSFCYNLSQRVRCTMNNGFGGKKVTERLPKESVLAYLPKTYGVMEIIPDRRIEGVSIHFNLDVFNELFNEIPQCLKDLYSVYDDSTDKHFYHQSRFNGETFFVLKQILECPYKGEIRRLFYEAKALELVSLKLAELGQNDSMELSELGSKDLDRTREAYNILLANLDQPPSLIDLSRLVGTNRNKLNRGFKEVYGDTAFNVLRNARMSRAWSLIEKTDLNFSEIALSVGYNNQANFTTAFRKQFGKTPKTVRRSIDFDPFQPVHL